MSDWPSDWPTKQEVQRWYDGANPEFDEDRLYRGYLGLLERNAALESRAAESRERVNFGEEGED